MSLPYLNLLRRWLSAAAVCGALLSSAFATSVIAPDFDQLVNESDYVVRAVVKSVTSEYRASPNGRKIITKVEVEVREVVTGAPPAQVVLEMLGGKVGDESMVLEGAPQFKVGDEDILFVSGNGRNIYPLFAIMHGRYPVLHEPGTGRAYMARSNRVPLQDTAEVAQSMSEGAVAGQPPKVKSPAQALTPEQFVQQIKAAVNPGYVRAHQQH